MERADRELLDLYLAGRDEAAFRTLVKRYVDLVHGVARRVTRDEELARDVSQAVFVQLATRASLIPPGLSLTAWLHRTTHSLAANQVRGEARRKKRERQAMAEFEMSADDNDDAGREKQWQALVPVVDQLIDALPGADREIVLARFYRNESHAAIASRLGLSETLARKRSSRALEKLRGMLGRRGIVTTSAALAALLPAQVSASPAPAALTGSILQAVQGITPLAPAGLKAALLVMNTTQKILIAAAAAVFLASLGYAVRPPEEVAAVAGRVTVPGSPAGAKSTASTEGRPASASNRVLPATAEGRRKRLDQILTISNPAARRREMIAFVELLQPGQFEDLCAAFPSGNMPRKPNEEDLKGEQELLIAAWAERDQEGALKRLRNPWMNYSATMLASAMGASYPESALEWAKEPMWGEYFLGGLAKVDLPCAIEAIREMPEKDRVKALHYLWCNLDHEPEKLARMVELIGPGPERTYLVKQAADIEAYYQPSSALAALKADPEGMQQADLEKLFRTMAWKDSEAAIAGLQELPEGPPRLNGLRGITQSIAFQDPAQAFALLDRYPEVASDGWIATLTSYGYYRGHEAAAIEGLGRIGDPEAREQEQFRYLRMWQRDKPEQAQPWIEAHAGEFSAELREKLADPGERQAALLKSPDTP